mmetsp:Transcript_53605/g.60702  ORF Transcript_53605/g.60702 Transcript_53605/m.60702 type:complete len:112 (+) Transcript_53605:133-468(+)
MDIVFTEDVSLNLSVAAAGDDNDDINNDNPHPQCESSIGDLDSIQQQEYSTAEYINLDEYVYTYNSTADKTKLIILETHRVNNNNDNSIDNEADVVYDGVPDNSDDYGAVE